MLYLAFLYVPYVVMFIEELLEILSYKYISKLPYNICTNIMVFNFLLNYIINISYEEYKY